MRIGAPERGWILFERHVPRKTFLALLSGIILIVFFQPLRGWVSLSFRDAAYSHLVLIPPISGYFLYSERNRLFSAGTDAIVPGLGLIAPGIVLYLVGAYRGDLILYDDYLSMMTVALLLCWTGTYVLLFGLKALRDAQFAFLFLLFMIPLPTRALDGLVGLLQRGSTEATGYLFQLTGIPFEREGYTFHLPGISIEVAAQCSGIRSTMALFITSVLAGHLFLETTWKKSVLWLSVFPITILKNAARIAVLSLLGVYVDPSFITDSLLHRRGGVLFFILALCLLGPILWSLSRSERERARGAGEGPAG